MLESRASYGYYGTGHGATGEVAPKVHKRGWRFMNFYFETTAYYCEVLSIRACDYAHAVKQAKAWARKEGCEIVGDAEGWEKQREW